MTTIYVLQENINWPSLARGFFAILLMKIWSRVRYSTMDYGAIFPRELMYTTEGGKSFLARNKQSFFEDFGLLLSFVLKEKLQQGWLINSNNDNYINNHHHCIYDHGHNIGTLILILIIKLINYPPWRPLLEVHSFPWASLSEYYSHLETDNVKYPCIFSR